MMDDHTAKCLWDARRAAERIGRFTSGRTCDDYGNARNLSLLST